MAARVLSPTTMLESAGLAAAYNAPLAATIFALEILVLWNARYILPCVVASVFSAATMNLLGRSDPIYPVGEQFRRLALASSAPSA